MENTANQNPSKKAATESDIIFWLALSGITLSAVLHIVKKNPQNPLIDLCAAPFVLWKLYTKLK